VLVVDDDLEWIEVMREILDEEGHVVLTATNGIEALAVARNERPDLVLLDLEMPKMDGRTFLVVLSGADDSDRVGAESVRKPLRLHTLLGLLERAAANP
jgi:CheY-like chemotaxis protein